MYVNLMKTFVLIENSVKMLYIAVLGEEWRRIKKIREKVAKQLKDVLRLMYIIFTH